MKSSKKRIIGFTGNRAELFIQSNLFLNLSKDNNVEFSLLTFNNQEDAIYTEQLKNLQEQGVNILQSISSKDKSGAHLSVVNDIIVEINDLIDGEQFDLAIVYADRYESLLLCLDCSTKKFQFYILGR